MYAALLIADPTLIDRRSRRSNPALPPTADGRVNTPMPPRAACGNWHTRHSAADARPNEVTEDDRPAQRRTRTRHAASRGLPWHRSDPTCWRDPGLAQARTQLC